MTTDDGAPMTADELAARLDALGVLFWRAGPDLLGTGGQGDYKTAGLDAALRIHKQALLAEADRRGHVADAEGWFSPAGHPGKQIRFAGPGAAEEWRTTPAPEG